MLGGLHVDGICGNNPWCEYLVNLPTFANLSQEVYEGSVHWKHQY